VLASSLLLGGCFETKVELIGPDRGIKLAGNRFLVPREGYETMVFTWNEERKAYLYEEREGFFLVRFARLKRDVYLGQLQKQEYPEGESRDPDTGARVADDPDGYMVGFVRGSGSRLEVNWTPKCPKVGTAVEELAPGYGVDYESSDGEASINGTRAALLSWLAALAECGSDKPGGLLDIERFTPGGPELATLGAGDSRGEKHPRDRLAEKERQSCERGDSSACYKLGVRYRKGDHVERDRSRAFTYFERACAAGNARGCLQVAQAYDRGEGVPADAVQASVFYKRACDAGEPFACEALKRDTCSISPWDAHRHGLVASFQAAAFQPDGKILLAGHVGRRALPGGARRILRLTQQGELDPSFLAGNRCMDMVAYSPDHLRVLPNGDIVMAWGYSYPDGLYGHVGGPASLPVLLKLDKDGKVQQQVARLQTRSGERFFGDISSLHVQSNGRVILSGNFSAGALHAPASRELALLALTPEGYVDEDYLNASLPAKYLEAGPMVSDSRGRLLACLRHRTNRSPEIGGLLAFAPDGRPDAALIDKAREYAPGEECMVAVQPDDRILLGVGDTGRGSGEIMPKRFHRLHADGSLDSSFPGTPFPEGTHRLLVAPGGMLVGLRPSGHGHGAWASPRVVRLNKDGSPDQEFNDAAAASLASTDIIHTDTVALRSDGALFAVPNYGGGDALAAPVLLRPDGQLDPGFHPPGFQPPRAGS